MRTGAWPAPPGQVSTATAWDCARDGLHPWQAKMVRLPPAAWEAWTRPAGPLPCGSPLPKALGVGQHVRGGMEGHAGCCPSPCTREEHSGLAAGPGLHAFSLNCPCETPVQLAVPAMLASLKGRKGKRVAMVLGGAVLDRWRRLQTRPYRVTGLLWAQHGLGRGSGNNTTSNNWQERTRGPFQGHRRPAPFLLRLGAGQTDPAGDGDSSAALLGVLCNRHSPSRHGPIPRCGGEAMLKNSWLGGGSPTGTVAPAASAERVWCRARCTYPMQRKQGAAHLPPACLPPVITAWLLIHMPSLGRRTKVNRP